jgi:hypothetical protein
MGIDVMRADVTRGLRRTISSQILLAAWLVGSLGCSEKQLDAVNDHRFDSPPATWQIFPRLGAPKVDVLFMVDNSQSMTPLQGKLTAGFSKFIEALNALPDGPPDMHVAVISSDTGPGKFDLPESGCSFRGDAGRFRFQPRGACATSPLLSGQTYLQVNNGVASYTGSVVDAFNCIAPLGDQGCGFEGPLKSVRWALDPASRPGENQGFLRADARLAVVLITTKDDCSVPDDSDLFDPAQTLMSSALGPFSSFRCNEFGHLCRINNALRRPPRGAADNLQGCVSDETPAGMLTKVADEVAFLKSLKTDLGQVFVAAITGPATPYGIAMVMEGADVEPHPRIKHSCTLATGEYADPAVRLQQWVAGFGVNGLLLPICADSMAPQLETVAQQVGRSASTMCVTGPYGLSGGQITQPQCRVADRTSKPTGGFDEQLVPNCVVTGNVPPCWTATHDAACSNNSLLLTIDRGPTPILPDGGSEYTCEACPSHGTEVGCPFVQLRTPDGAS